MRFITISIAAWNAGHVLMQSNVDSSQDRMQVAHQPRFLLGTEYRLVMRNKRATYCWRQSYSAIVVKGEGVKDERVGAAGIIVESRHAFVLP